MNGSPDDKDVVPDRECGPRGRPNLRLIRGEQPEREPHPPENRACRTPATTAAQRSWDDDDDPGPTAA
jgi:hypothetical protein